MPSAGSDFNWSPEKLRGHLQGRETWWSNVAAFEGQYDTSDDRHPVQKVTWSFLPIAYRRPCGVIGELSCEESKDDSPYLPPGNPRM